MRKEERTKSFKKGIDSDQGRRRRDDTRVQIRKNKKEEGLAKRRAMATRAMDHPDITEQTSQSNSLSSQCQLDVGDKKAFTIDDIPKLIANLSAQDMDNSTVLQSIRGFRRMLTAERSPPVQEVVDSGALPLFVSLLDRHDDPSLQFEAAWALTNVASTDQTMTVVDHGAIHRLINLVKTSPSADVREQCAWCLGNVAGDCPSLRDYCLEQGALEPFLMNIAQPASKSLLQNVVWALSNLCRGKPKPALALVAPAIPFLSNLLNSDIQEVVTDAVWALSYLSDGDDARIQAVMDGGGVPALVRLLSSESASIISPALRTLGNFVSGNDSQTQAVLDAGVLNHVPSLLEHGRKNVRKETCWLLSNIAAGTKSQIEQLLMAPSHVSEVVSLSETAEWEVRKEATWVLSNIATGGSDKHIDSLVELGGISGLCAVLQVADARVVQVALEALEIILCAGRRMGKSYESLVDEADGVDALESLQEHENEDIYDKAVYIIETYFGTMDFLEDENLAPTASEHAFEFGLSSIKTVDNSEGSGRAQAQHQPQPLQPFNFGGPVMNFELSA